MPSVNDMRVELPWGVLYIGDDDPARTSEEEWDPVSDPFVDRFFVHLQTCHEQHGPVLVRVAEWSTAPALGAHWTGTIETPSGRLRIGDLLDERESRFVAVDGGRCQVSLFADPVESPDVVTIYMGEEREVANELTVLVDRPSEPTDESRRKWKWGRRRGETL